MQSIFTPRGLLSLWAIVTASMGLSPFLKAFAGFIENEHPEQVFAALLDTLNSIVPLLVNLVFQVLPLETVLVYPPQRYAVAPSALLALVGLIILLVGVWLLRRALKTRDFFDDYMALTLLYVLLQVAVGVWVRANLISHDLNSTAVALLMTLIILLQAFRAGAWHDSKTFFRALIQVYVVWLILRAVPTLHYTAASAEEFGIIGAQLATWGLFPEWTVLGALIAFVVLYTVGTKPKKDAAAVVAGLKSKVDDEFEKARKSL